MSNSDIKYLFPSTEVNPQDPFLDDLLERRAIATNLTSFLTAFSDQPFALGLNGSWGSGKTYFVKRWQALLNNEGYKTIYFNAWENDFADDPFAALLSEFQSLVIDGSEQSVWRKLASAGLPVLKRVTIGALKNLTLGVVDIDNRDIEQMIGDAVGDAAKQILENCEHARASINAFRDELTNYVRRSSDDIPKKPVFYFIDELDRCRPTFSISVLERVKHLLNVPGIIFVFSWDRTQLNSTIKSIYGEKTSDNGYLLRFVDLEYDLPKPKQSEWVKSKVRSLNITKYLQGADRNNDLEELEKLFPKFVDCLNLSVRETEKALTLLAVYLKMLPSKKIGIIDLACFLITLRIKNPDDYRTIRDVAPLYADLVEKKLPALFGMGLWKDPSMGYIEGLLIVHYEKHNRQLPSIGTAPDKIGKKHSWALGAQNEGADRCENLNQMYRYFVTAREQKSPVIMVTELIEFVFGFKSQ